MDKAKGQSILDLTPSQNALTRQKYLFQVVGDIIKIFAPGRFQPLLLRLCKASCVIPRPPIAVSTAPYVNISRSMCLLDIKTGINTKSLFL